MLGFLGSGAGAPLVLRAPAAAGVATCASRPSMKASGGKPKAKAKANKAKANKAKAKAPAAAVAASKAPAASKATSGGFGKEAPAPAGNVDADANAQDGVDGSIGGSTPKRIVGQRAKLTDPMRDIVGMEEGASNVDASDGDIAMAKEAARLALVRTRREEISVIGVNEELRWGWGTTGDEIVEMLAVAKRDGRLDETLISNRDFVTSKCLYRFSSAILQAEGDGALEEAANMRELRRELIEICWHCDRPLREELYRAEARMVQALRAPPESNTLGEVEARCGESRTQVDGFWLVVYGAVAAWEVREKAQSASAESDQLAVQERVKAVAAAVNESRFMSERLSPCLLAVGKVLVLADPEEQGAVLEALKEEDVMQMRAIVEQVRLWPQMSYGPFAEKLQAIVDYAVARLAGGQTEALSPFRFKLADMERGSRLLEFKKRNDKNTNRGSRKKFSLFK